MEIGVTLFIVGILVAAIWLIIELKRLKHKVFALLLIGLILFSYISASVVFAEKNIDYTSIGGLSKAAGIYFNWLGSVFLNIKTITANAIKMDWTGDEENFPQEQEE